MFESTFFNRDENGLETNIDGFEIPYDSDLGVNDTSRAKIIYSTNEEEPQLPDEQ